MPCAMFQRAESTAALLGFDAATAFFADCVAPSPAPALLWVAHLDPAGRCLQLASYPLGAGAIVLPARAILSDAARLGGAALLLAHRDDSDGPGRHRPLERAATRLLAHAAEACGITLLDHLVFEAGGVTSMRRVGLL